VLIALVGIVATLDGVLLHVRPQPEDDKGGFNSRRAWAHLLRAADWIKAMRARLAEEGRAERAAQLAEEERLGKPRPRAGRKPGVGGKKPPAGDKLELDNCIAGRTDEEVMEVIFADLAVVATMLGDDDAARRLAIYQREAQALLGSPTPASVAEAQRRIAARTMAASRGRERQCAGVGANPMTADRADMAARAPDSG
jgi:hypothetical protein